MNELTELFGLFFVIATGVINAVMLALGKIPIDGKPLNSTKFWAWGGSFIALGLGAVIGIFNATPEALDDTPFNRVLYGVMIGGAAIGARAVLKQPVFSKLEGKES